MKFRYCLVGIVFAVAAAVNADEDKPFYLTLETPPAPELSPKDALASFVIAPGFRIELVAAEPLVEDPVAITWDEDGHLYAVEMRGFMPDSFGNGEKDPVGAVVRLTDTDSNGRADQREVLLDKLILPRALAIINEGLLIAEPPNLWLCPTPTGLAKDIDCSKKRSLGNYGDQPGSVEHAENGLLLGLDNWLYNAKSDRRMRVRDGQLEVETTLFRGQWGITQDNTGRLFYNTNSNLLLGDFYSAQYAVAAGNRSAAGLNERIHVNDEMFSIRVNPGVNRAYVPGVLRKDGRLKAPTSAAGMIVYRGHQFPASYSQHVFVTESAANAVAQLRLGKNGLAISSEHVLYPDEKWGQREFMASTDERFRPVNASVGPDGALYIVDMYRGIIQDHVFLTDELRAQALARSLDKPVGMGRIWRIVSTAKSVDYNASQLSTSTTEALIALLGHENAWHRETAQRLLIQRNDANIKARLIKASTNDNVLQAVHALWTLSGRNELDRDTVLGAIKHEQSVVKHTALQAGEEYLTAKDLLELADKRAATPAFKQQLTLSLSNHRHNHEIQMTLLNILRGESMNPYRRAAIQAALRGVELEFVQHLLKQSAWSASQEQATRFIEMLTLQGFRLAPAQSEAWLDFVLQQPVEAAWVKHAVLSGLFERTRDTNFERVELSAPHALFSTNDDKLWSFISKARRAFTWPGDELQADSKPLSPKQREYRALGAKFYTSSCANCHGADGAGIASLGPPLAQSPWVLESPERLARIILQGLRGPIEVAGKTWDSVMPGHQDFPDLTDEVASGLLNYLRRAWGHAERAVNPAFITDIRRQTVGRKALWTAEELLALDINTHYVAYAGKFGSPRFTLELIYNGRALEVKSAIFNGPLLEEKEDNFFFEPRQLKLEFIVNEDGTVPAVRLPNAGGASVLPRLEE